MKSLKMAALAVPALLTFGSAAMAQYDAAPKPFAVEVGGAWLTDSDTTDYTGEWGWRAGLRYDVPLGGYLMKPTEGKPGITTSVNLSYTVAEDNGNKIESVPVLLEARMPITEMFYAGAGIGASWVKGTAEISDGSSVGKMTDDTWNFAGALFVGANFSEALYTELRYNLNGDINDGYSADNVSLSVGYKF